MSNRPPIPTDIKRKVLVEAGHRCAIPTCRHIDIDVHHIVPWETCKKHEYENLIALCPNCHRRAHKKNEIDRKSLRLYKANLRYTHDKFSQFEVDTLFDLFRLPLEEHGLIPDYLTLLIKRLLDAGYVELGARTGGIAIGAKMIVKNPIKMLITSDGRRFIESLGVTEL